MEVWTERGKERENITGMTPVVDSANFQHSDARYGTGGDTLLSDDSSGAQSVLETNQYRLRIIRTPDRTNLSIHNEFLNFKESFASRGCGQATV